MSVPSGADTARRGRCGASSCGGVGLAAERAAREAAAGHRRQRGERAAEEEAAAEGLAHRPDAAQVVADQPGADRAVVAGEVAREGGLGGEDVPTRRRSGSPSARQFTRPTPSPQSRSPARAGVSEGRTSRPRESSSRPSDAFAALEDAAEERVRLQLLEEVVDREGGVAVVEPDDDPERDVLLSERIGEGPAELSPARSGRGAASPACGPRDRAAGDLPDLLDAERPDLRLARAEPEALERRAGEVSLRPLGEDRDLRAARSRART